MVGAARFELATSCTPSKRASQATLRPEPFRRIAPAGNSLCRLNSGETTLKSNVAQTFRSAGSRDIAVPSFCFCNWRQASRRNPQAGKPALRRRKVPVGFFLETPPNLQQIVSLYYMDLKLPPLGEGADSGTV